MIMASFMSKQAAERHKLRMINGRPKNSTGEGNPKGRVGPMGFGGDPALRRPTQGIQSFLTS